MEEKKNYCKIKGNIVIIFLHVLKDSKNRKCLIINYLGNENQYQKEFRIPVKKIFLECVYFPL